MIVLDTSAIIDFTRGEKQLVQLIEAAEKRGEIVAITSVSFFELFTPIFHKNLAKKERILRAFLGRAAVLALDQAASEESARIMGALLKIGRPVNVLDVLIAGIATVNNVELLIGSDADYLEIAKVTSLKIQVLKRAKIEKGDSILVEYDEAEAVVKLQPPKRGKRKTWKLGEPLNVKGIEADIESGQSQSC